MAGAVDFIVKSPDNKTQLLVEAKTSVDPSEQWVARLRRNLMEDATASNRPYFILALPKHFYVWKNAGVAGTVPPDFEVETSDVLRSYVDDLRSPLGKLTEQSFELVVRTWLEDLVKGVTSSGSGSWIVESGLNDRIRDGTVISEP